MRSREERLAYQRGYYAALRRSWPTEIVGKIPEASYRELAVAARELSSRIDHWMACDDRDSEEAMIAIDAARDQIEAAAARALEGYLSSNVAAHCPACSGAVFVKLRGSDDLVCLACHERDLR